VIVWVYIYNISLIFSKLLFKIKITSSGIFVQIFFSRLNYDIVYSSNCRCLRQYCVKSFQTTYPIVEKMQFHRVF